MSVLVEGISVIIKRKKIDEMFPGGWDAFVEDVPNQTLCADDELARVGFMAPDDMEGYVKYLENYGLRHLDQQGNAMDMVVADQLQGFGAKCDWAKLWHIDWDEDPNKKVVACRTIDSTHNHFIFPEWWVFDGSLSQHFGFIPSGSKEKSLKYLRHENGLDVYLNRLTGKESYIGRTGELSPLIND
jgi:hypothetical protein